MFPSFPRRLSLLLLCLILAFPAGSPASRFALPQTGIAAVDTPAPAHKGRAAAVTRVTAAGLFDYPVIQNGDSAPSAADTVGQYAAAARRGSIGLLAHNHSAGRSFFVFSIGDLITLTFDDGSTQSYEVTAIHIYQATDPDDFSQPFLDDRGKELKAKEVFNREYSPGTLTFQTCIAKDGHSSWGLLFIRAEPVK
ncbi:MAG: sortase [Anaerolineae bacterium]|nr:MAG: sortase [Anaerolineae bacterium]